MGWRYYTQLSKAMRKASFQACNFLCYFFIPRKCYQTSCEKWLHSFPYTQQRRIKERVEYYNRMPECVLGMHWITASEFKYPYHQKKKYTTYFFDLYNGIKYFPLHLRFAYLFGDVNTEPTEPTFVKSRPITNGYSNAVILKLNQIRHFSFIKDKKSYRSKKDQIVFRNVVRQPQRQLFMKCFYGHPMCNVGQINKDAVCPEWVADYLTIPQQLDYKFIACIEGNDVATNLEWVMSSNSIAVMPRPKYETWFMEGTLIPDYHYIEIKPDYSDMIEKLQFYIEHPKKAEEIIAHAHQFVREFQDMRTEKLIGLLTIQAYFKKSHQI